MKITIEFDYEVDGDMLTEQEIYDLVCEHIIINREFPTIIDIETSVIIINKFLINQNK